MFDEKSKVETFVADSASLVMNMLDATATACGVERSRLVEIFTDTLNAIEQWKIQEE